MSSARAVTRVFNGAADWQTALSDVVSLNSTGTMNGNSCGDTSGKRRSHRTDWRLPNIRELFSLVDFAFFDPAISNAAGTGQGSSSDPFTDLQTTFYGSSTSMANGTGLDQKLFVHFLFGFVADDNRFTFNGVFVTAVRGGS